MAIYTDQDKSDVKKLNEFLKNELSAVETYEQCLKKADSPQVTQGLQGLKQSHQARADMLRERIRSLGGEPAKGSGMWGGFAKMVEGGASLFGENSAISALEEGEDKGRDEYQRDADKLSAQNREFIMNSILPEQRRSHDKLNQIQSLAKHQ